LIKLCPSLLKRNGVADYRHLVPGKLRKPSRNETKISLFLTQIDINSRMYDKYLTNSSFGEVNLGQKHQ